MHSMKECGWVQGQIDMLIEETVCGNYIHTMPEVGVN